MTRTAGPDKPFPAPRRARKRAVRGTDFPGAESLLALGAGRRNPPALRRGSLSVTRAGWPLQGDAVAGGAVFDRFVVLDPALWTIDPAEILGCLGGRASPTARLGLVCVAPGTAGSLVEAYAGLRGRGLRPLGPDQLLTFGLATGWQLLGYRLAFPGYASALMTRLPQVD